MPLLLALLKFRAQQAYRMLQSIGFGVLLVFIPIAFLGVLLVLQFLYTTPAPWAGLLLIGSLIGLHYQRGDRFFLEQLLPHPWSVYGLEYSLLCSPFWFCFGYWGQWWNLVVGVLGILVLAIVPPPYASQKAGKTWGSLAPVDWIPLSLWEWRAGFRQQGWWWWLLYGLGFIGINYTFIPPVLVVVLALSSCFFYQAVAPKEIIQARNMQGHFLTQKIGESCLFFQALLLPHYGLFFYGQPSWQVLVGVLLLIIISSAWISFSICLQYSHYTYDTEQNSNAVPLAIFIGGSFIPFTWPLLPFLWIYYWRKAQQQLTYYA